MCQNKILLSAIFIFIYGCHSVAGDNSINYEYSRTIISNMGSGGNTLLNNQNAWEALDTLSNIENVFERQKNYMYLLNYYVGEGIGEMLDEYITREGRLILDSLKNMEKISIMCQDEYKHICRTKDERNKIIDKLVWHIENNFILCADDCSESNSYIVKNSLKVCDEACSSEYLKFNADRNN